jgi:hypothetical protein
VIGSLSRSRARRREGAGHLARPFFAWPRSDPLRRPGPAAVPSLPPDRRQDARGSRRTAEPGPSLGTRAGTGWALSLRSAGRRDPGERMRCPVARLRFVRTSGLWTLYWMRADLKRHAYGPLHRAAISESSSRASTATSTGPSSARRPPVAHPPAPRHTAPGFSFSIVQRCLLRVPLPGLFEPCLECMHLVGSVTFDSGSI